jgi:hypothetical protein
MAMSIVTVLLRHRLSHTAPERLVCGVQVVEAELGAGMFLYSAAQVAALAAAHPVAVVGVFSGEPAPSQLSDFAKACQSALQQTGRGVQETRRAHAHVACAVTTAPLPLAHGHPAPVGTEAELVVFIDGQVSLSSLLVAGRGWWFGSVLWLSTLLSLHPAFSFRLRFRTVARGG